MAPDPDVTLKEFMDLRFQAAEENAELRFKALRDEVSILKVKVGALENCINNDILHIIKLWRYIGSLAVGILAALALAWFLQRLGL